MTEPRYRRRKEERPAEITQAAMETFAEHGYAAARVDDVAKRAGISKGLLYLYFKTKEEHQQGSALSLLQDQRRAVQSRHS